LINYAQLSTAQYLAEWTDKKYDIDDDGDVFDQNGRYVGDTWEELEDDLQSSFNADSTLTKEILDELEILGWEMIEEDEEDEEDEEEKEKKKRKISESLKEKVKKIMQKITKRGKINQMTRIKQILGIYKNPITSKQLSKLINKPEPSIRRDLAKGVKDGLWKRIGKKGSRGVKYQKL